MDFTVILVVSGQHLHSISKTMFSPVFLQQLLNREFWLQCLHLQKPCFFTVKLANKDPQTTPDSTCDRDINFFIFNHDEKLRTFRLQSSLAVCVRVCTCACVCACVCVCVGEGGGGEYFSDQEPPRSLPEGLPRAFQEPFRGPRWLYLSGFGAN